MPLKLDAWQFPETAQGLRWTDEINWTPVAQTITDGLTGSQIVQEGVRLNGRPVTLTGGRNGSRSYSWMRRDDLLDLHATLTTPGDHTLTLRDGRQIPVIAAQDGDGPIKAYPVPRVDDIGPADTDDADFYWIETIRFIATDDIVEP